MRNLDRAESIFKCSQGDRVTLLMSEEPVWQAYSLTLRGNVWTSNAEMEVSGRLSSTQLSLASAL